MPRTIKFECDLKVPDKLLDAVDDLAKLKPIWSKFLTDLKATGLDAEAYYGEVIPTRAPRADADAGTGAPRKPRRPWGEAKREREAAAEAKAAAQQPNSGYAPVQQSTVAAE